ncbi:MAG: outer membrane protein assembly factor BamA [Candidatus Zixiibacteriota bacterium]
MRILVFIVSVIVSSMALFGVAPAAEAKKIKVHHVVFSGNQAYDEMRLEGLMLTRPSKFLATKEYHEEVFLDDLETLTTFYRQNGYLQAHISDTSVVIDSMLKTVDIAIGIYEGERTYIEGISLFENRFFPDSTLMSYIQMKAGDPLLRPHIEDAVVALLSLYAENGFLDASVTPTVHVNDSAHLALIDFTVSEGISSRVGSIDISGADRTHDNVILRESSFAQGDTIQYSELIETQRRLYMTGLFESVFVRPVASQSSFSPNRNVLIEIKEKPSSELGFSLGYGTVEKIRGRIELSTINLAGTARGAGISIEGNYIRQGTTLSFSEPWTLGTRWKTDLSLFGQFRQEPGYHARVLGGKVTLGRNIGRETTISATYRMENTTLSKVDPKTVTEELDPRIRSLTFSINHDTRDNLFNPSHGWFFNWANELAGSFLQGSNTFAKTVATLKRFESVSRSCVIGSALEVGWMGPFDVSNEVPVSELFYTGGPTSLRGFGYQLVGPLNDDGEPAGGEFKVVWNVLEVRQSIFRIFGGVLFVECGNVWPKVEMARLSELRIDAGIGLRMNSPLGILRLDYGVNLDAHPGEPGKKIFVSMGQAF